MGTAVPRSSNQGSQQRCAEISRSLCEPVAGTAAHAPVVLAVEERGAWAPKALMSAGLDPIRPTLEAWLEELGARLQLIRQPTRCTGPRRVYVCVAGAEGSIHRFDLDDSDFASFDLSGALSSPSSETRLHLVCVHGKRDRCCALEGGSYFRARAAGERTWMTSHLGGHRFAATTLTLPSGLCHGHLRTEHASLPFEDLPLPHLRGRVSYDAPTQRAEIALMRAYPEETFRHVETDTHETGARVSFQGTVLRTVSLQKVTRPAQILSCGDALKPSTSWDVESIDE